MKSWQLFLIFTHIWIAPHIPVSVALVLGTACAAIAFFDAVLPE